MPRDQQRAVGECFALDTTQQCRTLGVTAHEDLGGRPHAVLEGAHAHALRLEVLGVAEHDKGDAPIRRHGHVHVGDVAEDDVDSSGCTPCSGPVLARRARLSARADLLTPGRADEAFLVARDDRRIGIDASVGQHDGCIPTAVGPAVRHLHRVVAADLVEAHLHGKGPVAIPTEPGGRTGGRQPGRGNHLGCGPAARRLRGSSGHEKAGSDKSRRDQGDDA